MEVIDRGGGTVLLQVGKWDEAQFVYGNSLEEAMQKMERMIESILKYTNPEWGLFA